MVDLDLKDRKILFQLDLNCRQSNAQIGKKVGLSRKVVEYRIKRMEDEDIITCYWTAIDTYILGYQVFRIYINFNEISAEVKNEIIKYFIDNKNSWAVISFKGEIDFDVIFWVKDINHFYSYWNNTLENFGKYFSHHIITPLFQVIAFKKSFLLQNQNDKIEYIHYKLNYSGKLIEIDKIDYQLLNEIVSNARIPLIELAYKLGCSSQAVKYRLNNLMKNKIIKAFRVAIDFTKLKVQEFGVNIYLADPLKRKPILEYLSNQPYLEYIDEGVGFADIQIAVIVENLSKLMDIMDEIDSKFPGAIKKQTFNVVKEYHKERWLPETEFK